MIKKAVHKEVKDFVLVDLLHKTLKAGNQNCSSMLALEYLYGFGVSVEDMINFERESKAASSPNCQVPKTRTTSSG